MKHRRDFLFGIMAGAAEMEAADVQWAKERYL
jgi:hypothetical protein